MNIICSDNYICSISFHVGHGCLETGAFVAAIEQSRKVFDIGATMGFDMHLLDIGGGFPGEQIQNVETNITFERVCVKYFIFRREVQP